ncbi:hypothetical protein GCM10023321_44860 [Pseudonocardia eucalypti]|uniref:Putative zinc-finger domain-containing protein n=1 Tax=Pseudonocardia eucalypti TaxID=648755 RepID=A0ABP9QFS2_9PSEU
MSEIDCQRFQQLAPEFALNGLVGRERAQMLSHLTGCPTCQKMAHDLAETADRILELVPEADPPAGFELELMTTFRRPGREYRWPASLAAALLAIALVLGGWIVGRSNPAASAPADDARPGVRTVLYAPLIKDELWLGQAYMDPDESGWMYISLTAPVPDTTITCDIIRPEGSTVRIGTFPFTHGHAEWGAATLTKLDAAAVARLSDSQGNVIASARFPPPEAIPD